MSEVILGIVFFVLANAISIVGARAILEGTRDETSPTDLMVFLLVRLAMISGVVLIAGLLKILTPLGLFLAAAGLHVPLIPRVLRLKRPSYLLPAIGKPLTIISIILVIRLVVQIWIFCPHLGDAVAYHLPKIAEWVRAGSFTAEMGLHPHASFPAGFELIETWWVAFFHHDVLIEAAGAEFLILGCSAVYAMTRHLGTNPRWAWLAAMSFGLIPGIYLSSLSCLNDLPAAAVALTTLSLFLGRAPGGLIFLSIGLGLGIKGTYGFSLPGWILVGFMTRRASLLKRGLEPSLLASLSFLGVLVGLFWYARNILMFGDPFYPLGSPEVHDPVRVQFGPSAISLWENLRDLINSRICDRGPYGANVDNISGWGPVSFGCGAISVLLGAWVDRSLRKLLLGFGVSLSTLMLFVQHDPWSLKYAMFFPAICCISVGFLAQVSRHLRYLLILALSFSAIGTCVSFDLPLMDARKLARQPWSQRTALYLDEPNITESRVACWGGFGAHAYLLYGPDFSREVIYLRSSSESHLKQELDSKALHLLFAVPESTEQQAILDRCIHQGFVKLIGGHVFARGP